jgi:hypothetical protein
MIRPLPFRTYRGWGLIGMPIGADGLTFRVLRVERRKRRAKEG